MIIKLIWVFLAAFAAFIAVISVNEPQVLLDNQFVKSFVSHEVINALIVMVTVTLAVSFSLIEKVNILKKKVLSSGYGDGDKKSICDSLDEVKSKIMSSAKLMVGYLILSLFFLLVANSSHLSSVLMAKSLLIGAVFFFFLHSIILMVEMYIELYKWDLDPDDI